jgi:hypothetical protein
MSSVALRPYASRHVPGDRSDQRRSRGSARTMRRSAVIRAPKRAWAPGLGASAPPRTSHAAARSCSAGRRPPLRSLTSPRRRSRWNGSRRRRGPPILRPASPKRRRVAVRGTPPSYVEVRSGREHPSAGGPCGGVSGARTSRASRRSARDGRKGSQRCDRTPRRPANLCAVTGTGASAARQHAHACERRFGDHERGRGLTAAADPGAGGPCDARRGRR